MTDDQPSRERLDLGEQLVGQILFDDQPPGIVCKRWPALRKADWTTIVAAVAMSAVSQTTIGLLPPISSATIFPG